MAQLIERCLSGGRGSGSNPRHLSRRLSGGNTRKSDCSGGYNSQSLGLHSSCRGFESIVTPVVTMKAADALFQVLGTPVDGVRLPGTTTDLKD